MEDITALLGSRENEKDLVDKLISLLDRQTDHKISPNVLLGILGLFNVLTIMSVVRETPGSGVRQVTDPVESNGDAQAQAQTLNDTLGSLMNSQGGGQPDLMGLLGNLASKKKINPGLLLSLFSMLNQGSAGANQNMPAEPNPGPAPASQSAAAAGVSAAPAQSTENSKTGDYKKNS
ncbi:hypothetical protein [Phosphitispora fastidiosa]|uniref:hypothetical protein n=1 Tax=Phosphitispora fastidiosa TaxID=2837202 RepID=UPI001E5FEDD4|nr:hypothetical protein [Phosphitispora fastidiosa]MBU7006656.1 hypothetical protein [Phosphitispora fastidiosa]